MAMAMPLLVLLLQVGLSSGSPLGAAGHSLPSATPPEASLVLLPAESTAPGGRCLDGSMAGYYFLNGTDGGKTFTIYLKGTA